MEKKKFCWLSSQNLKSTVTKPFAHAFIDLLCSRPGFRLWDKVWTRPNLMSGAMGVRTGRKKLNPTQTCMHKVLREPNIRTISKDNEFYVGLYTRIKINQNYTKQSL